MNISFKLSLLFTCFIVVGCGNTEPKNYTGSTQIKLFEIAPSDTTKPTIKLEHDSETFTVFSEPAITKSDIQSVGYEEISYSISKHMPPANGKVDPNLIFTDYALNITLKPEGRIKFMELTERIAGKTIPIMVNGNVINNPRVAEPIKGGFFQIVGSFTQEQVESLINNL